MLQFEVLVRELVTVDFFTQSLIFTPPNTIRKELLTRLPTSAIMLGKVPALDHKIRDNTVEG